MITTEQAPAAMSHHELHHPQDHRHDHHHHQMAQMRQARAQREQDAAELIERGFAACDRRLTEGLQRGGPVAFLREAHKRARQEVLRVAISLQGRDSVDAALRRLTGQCPYRDYDISYNER